MTTSWVLIATICIIVFVKIFIKFYKWYLHSLIVNKIPGPKTYPLIGNTLTVLSVPREDRYRWNQELYKKYDGGIFRIWFGAKAVINLTTAENITPIMSSKKLITKSRVYDFIRPWLGQGVLTSTGVLWHRQRKLITPAFHFNILGGFSVVMFQKADILKEVIESKLRTNPNEPIDMLGLLSRCTLDILCETALGVNIHAQTKESTEYLKALHNIAIQVCKRLVQPWLHNNWIYYQTSRGKEFKHDIETVQSFTNEVIRKRKLARKIQQSHPCENMNSNKTRQRAFLDLLLDASERENMPLTDDEVREQVDTLLFAGHDTTAAAVNWALLCISNNPEVEEKIHEEQLLVFGDSDEPATLQQIYELKYLDTVIKETLRLFPSVPTVGRNVTEDIEIAGYKIPKGCFIAIQIQAVHCDPKHWSNPEKFDPDRFLPKNSQGRHPYAYLPFSAGSRNCIGQKFALLEQKIILTALLRKWRVKCFVKCEEVNCYNELILRPQTPIDIYFTPK